ncbi:MAG: hypothetical protein WA777_18540 [Rhodanobacter sp.]
MSTTATPTPNNPMHRTFVTPMPRFKSLTICICAALYGIRDPKTAHMLDRNLHSDALKQMEAA